jgi:hypothetical protein
MTPISRIRINSQTHTIGSTDCSRQGSRLAPITRRKWRKEPVSPNESGVAELAAWRGPCACTARDRAEVRSEGRRPAAPEPETLAVRRRRLSVGYVRTPIQVASRKRRVRECSSLPTNDWSRTGTSDETSHPHCHFEPALPWSISPSRRRRVQRNVRHLATEELGKRKCKEP